METKDKVSLNEAIEGKTNEVMSTPMEHKPPNAAPDIEPEAPVNNSSDGQASPSTPPSEKWECTICMDEAKEPVISICGHLYCWPCIYRWLENHSDCPVCKSALTREKLIPLYGRGGTDNRDPRDSTIPQRPQGVQTPQPARREHGGGGGGMYFQRRDRNPDFYFSAGAGFGPMFSFGFPSPYQMAGGGGGGGAHGNAGNSRLTPQQQAQQSRIAKWMFVLSLVLLLLIMFGT